METNSPVTASSPDAKGMQDETSDDFGYQFHSMTLNLENKGKFRNFYKVGHIMVRSAIGTIRKCLHIPSKQIRAVEFISKRLLNGIQNKPNVLEEIDQLNQLNHPNIVKSHENFQDSKRYYIIMECKGGLLFDRIVENMFLSEHFAANILRQMLSAISYCHSKEMYHRELSPESLLLDSKHKDANVKVFDFGMAQIFDPNHTIKSSLSLPFYDAPEIISHHYDYPCDIWSAGVILYVLLCGYPPFNGKNYQEVAKNINRGKFSFAGGNWVSVSKEAKDLIMKMLVYNPKERITAEQAIQHPWIKTQAKEDQILLKPLATESLQQLKRFMVCE